MAPQPQLAQESTTMPLSSGHVQMIEDEDITAKNSTESPLLRLPPELRVQVFKEYSDLFPSVRGDIQQSGNIDEPRGFLALAQTSRQTRSEFLATFLRNALFIIMLPLKDLKPFVTMFTSLLAWAPHTTLLGCIHFDYVKDYRPAYVSDRFCVDMLPLLKVQFDHPTLRLSTSYSNGSAGSLFTTVHVPKGIEVLHRLFVAAKSWDQNQKEILEEVNFCNADCLLLAIKKEYAEEWMWPSFWDIRVHSMALRIKDVKAFEDFFDALGLTGDNEIAVALFGICSFSSAYRYGDLLLTVGSTNNVNL
ncbi:hypothetical protein P154DRAFT_608164 [Amniculicola lignicola CBS 123094]|uniref:F-box domain-containing protein n=1 Tax=Amniculicola lignicola CBS 123094 TaxID=1392246 RepID=A0A6A5WBJ7_9PLEO|nr:hypothetical protein P154DRAFT_608164 [Amniculicola lignicola CBS 123094]